MKTIKKFSVLVVIFLITTTAFSQENKWQKVRKQKAEKFAELAAKEFNLSKKEQTAVFDRKLQHFKEQQVANKQAKKGNISEEEKKKPNKDFGKFMMKLTGKKMKELQPFFKKTYAELKKIKVKK